MKEKDLDRIPFGTPFIKVYPHSRVYRKISCRQSKLHLEILKHDYTITLIIGVTQLQSVMRNRESSIVKAFEKGTSSNMYNYSIKYHLVVEKRCTSLTWFTWHTLSRLLKYARTRRISLTTVNEIVTMIRIESNRAFQLSSAKGSSKRSSTWRSGRQHSLERERENEKKEKERKRSTRTDIL